MRTLNLANYPQKLEPNDLTALLKRVRENDNAAIEAMILHHVRLTISIVNRYIANYSCRYLDDDLDSAALAGLITAVNNVANGKMANHDNIGGYITDYVNHALQKCMRHNSTVYFPRDAERKLILPLTEKLGHWEIGKDNSKIGTNPEKTSELLEELNIITTTTLEEKILKLRGEGYNDSEISTRLGLSRLAIQRIRSKLKTRYQKREKND